MDDTLLTSDLQISSRAVSAIQKLAARKIFIVICTGRMRKGIEPFVRRLGVAQIEAGKYAILSNGSSIFDLQAKREIFLRARSTTKFCFVQKRRRRDWACRAKSMILKIFSPKRENDFSRKDVALTKMELKIPSDFDEFLKQGFSKMLIPGDEQTVRKLFGILQDALGERAVVVTSKPYFWKCSRQIPARAKPWKFLADGSE